MNQNVSRILQGLFPGGRPHQSVIIPNSEQLNHAAGNLIQQKQYPPIQRNGNNNSFKVDPSRLNLNSAGTPLSKEVLQKMESVFNADFSSVKIHTGGYQAESIGALAFTTGNDIYFAQGQYNPHSPHGQRILGHELTHVVQQRSGRVKNPFGNGIAVVNDHGMEAEAERMGIISTLIKPPPVVSKNIIQRVQDKYEAHSMVMSAWGWIQEDYKSAKYWPEDHNLCLAYIEFKVGKPDYLWSYSNMSRLRKKKGDIKVSTFIPEVKKPTYTPSGMGIYHTEPRLLNYIIDKYKMKNIKEITLTTSRDCCSSCQKVISEFRNDYPGIALSVYEMKAQIENWEPISDIDILK